MAPVTAAAVVVALAVTLVALREVRNEPSVSPARLRGNLAPPPPSSPPKYYAALDDPAEPRSPPGIRSRSRPGLGELSTRTTQSHDRAATRTDVRRRDGSGGRPHVRRRRRVASRCRPVFSRPPGGLVPAAHRSGQSSEPPRSPSCPSPASRPERRSAAWRCPPTGASSPSCSSKASGPSRTRVQHGGPAHAAASTRCPPARRCAPGPSRRTASPQATAGAGTGTSTARSPGWPTGRPWRSTTASYSGENGPPLAGVFSA